MYIKTETATAAGINVIFYAAGAYRMLSACERNTRLVCVVATGLAVASVAISVSGALQTMKFDLFYTESKDNSTWIRSAKRIGIMTIAPSMAIGAASVICINAYVLAGKMHV